MTKCNLNVLFPVNLSTLWFCFLNFKFFPTVAIVFTAHPGRLDILWPTDNSRQVARCFLAAVLLLGIYLTGHKPLPNGIPRGQCNKSSALMFFTMKWHYFPPSIPILGPSEWARLTVRIVFATSLSCALGNFSHVHVSAVCRAAGGVMKLHSSTHQRVKLLSVTTVFIWLLLKHLFYNKNVRLQFEDLLLGYDTPGSSGGSWTLLGQMEPLAIAFYASASILTLIKSKLNILNVHLNVQLITCLRLTRAHTKYVLFIKLIILI